jgi:Holliday junction DNA helicase RuvA
MYAYIKGKLITKTPTSVVIDVGGVGYDIKISLNTSAALTESECKLYTYLYVKEDVQALFGFIDEREKHLFLQLISISGIGPSTGLAFLSSLTTEEIRTAIAAEDVNTIKSVKGVGPKTAERVILELKDKIRKEGVQGGTNLPKPSGDKFISFPPAPFSEALDALLTLGIPKIMAEKNLETIRKLYGDQLKTEEIIKYALKAK